MNDVMISYSHIDKLVADAVCNHLEGNGVRVWIAPRDIPAGSSYPSSILEGIRSCSIIILIFSANSNTSRWVHSELERGVHYGKIIIPFKIEEVIPLHGDIELCTCTQHWLDAITPPLEANIRRLVDTVKILLDNPDDGTKVQKDKAYSELSPIGQIYHLTNRWVQNNYAYYVLENLTNEQKSILRNSPKDFQITDENVILFMLEASLHYGGDWFYWAKQVPNKDVLAKHLVKMLLITYVRPRYRSLYLLQEIERSSIETWLNSFGLDSNQEIMQLMEKFVFTGKVHEYLVKASESSNIEVAKRAKSVIFEIDRYQNVTNKSGLFKEE
jgi:hypothetical protein